jgi:hypothetical protein
MRPEPLVRRVVELVNPIDPTASVSCSSHSIDIVLNGASKLDVVEAVRGHAGADATVLRFGDKGRWPGNDYTLLQDALGFSVDEVSNDLGSCWNVAPAGSLGLQATLYYLSKLSMNSPGGVRFSPW